MSKDLIKWSELSRKLIRTKSKSFTLDSRFVGALGK
jgi:hypothetical protein